jgi:hypothetical protein
MNPNSILFLYEGATDKIFYDKLLELHSFSRNIRICKLNLLGVSSINQKVKNKITAHLGNANFSDCNNIHVIVAHDRDGSREKESILDIGLLNKYFNKEVRIVEIKEIIATQELESWFFHDIENIYEFLGVPKGKRNVRKFHNAEAFKSGHLSHLFHQNGKHYQKGDKAQEFLSRLDIMKIYSKTPELQELVKYINSLCKK